MQHVTYCENSLVFSSSSTLKGHLLPNGKFLLGIPAKMTYSKAKEACSNMGFQVALAESVLENAKALIDI